MSQAGDADDIYGHGTAVAGRIRRLGLTRKSEHSRSGENAVADSFFLKGFGRPSTRGYHILIAVWLRLSEHIFIQRVMMKRISGITSSLCQYLRLHHAGGPVI